MEQWKLPLIEENRRLIQNALEMALSLGDFQENINKGYGPQNILRETEKRVQYLIPFEANAFYLVDQDQSDFALSICEPSDKNQFMMVEERTKALADSEKQLQQMMKLQAIRHDMRRHTQSSPE